MPMSRVRDIVDNRELFSVEEHQTVADVAQRMADLHIGAIMVLSGDHLRGVFSERDLMKRVVVAHRDPDRTPVSEVMSRDLATIDEMASIDDAMELMRRCNCRHLPVLQGNRPVGFLSMRDLMNYELERKTEELHQMRAYIHGSA
jgi:CBS domain-containing protein